jgi:3-oxoadipate enol-lactonase
MESALCDVRSRTAPIDMRIIDCGQGAPIVVIPGIQGRWEWLKPAVDALATRCRVITFSLADEPSCDAMFDAGAGFACYVEQVRHAMDLAAIQRAAICGISYGGLIAVTFAAAFPDRTTSLILVSALPPSWTPDVRVRSYLRAPRLLTPVFCLASLRMYREIACAHPGLRSSIRVAVRHAWNVVTHAFSPSLMARRVRLVDGIDRNAASHVRVPTLVVIGEAALDAVVPVSRTREYLTLIPHARVATIERTGHLGSITRPDVFGDIVSAFVADAAQTETRRHVV